MVLLQALISLVGKSARKTLNALFGCAVVALFGRTSSKPQTFLAAVVGAAAGWPLLVVGVALPKLATLVLALVPLSDRVPEGIVRLVWLGLAILTPAVVGLVVAAMAPPGSNREPFFVRTLRGYPVTLGIAASFLLMFLTVPVLELARVLEGEPPDGQRG